MDPADFEKLREDVEDEILAHGSSVGVIGFTRVAVALLRSLEESRLSGVVRGVYATKDVLNSEGIKIRPLEALMEDQLDVLVIASDADKEQLLREALPYITGTPKVIVAGYGHLAFRDSDFEEIKANLLVPSIANGYPNCLPHIYQCLLNAARLGLNGSVVEFGTFKGGTTAFMAQVIQHLGQQWPVVTFDTFDGFPPRRSPLDMYDHPGAVFTDIGAVRSYLQRYGVKVVEGDIVETAKVLADDPIVLSFIDTDNYSSARAAIDVVRENTVVGGAIVFDHYTGVDRFRYTLGERFAAQDLINDPAYFNLHGTGVFWRQR